MNNPSKQSSPQHNLRCELKEAKQDVKYLNEVIQSGLKFPTPNYHITLSVPPTGIQQSRTGEYTLFSEPIDFFGFQFKLLAHGDAALDHFAFYLCLLRPLNYAGFFQFGLKHSWRLKLANSPSSDLLISPNDTILEDCAGILLCSWKTFRAGEPSTFLQPDGSLRIEVDFAIKWVNFDKTNIQGNQDACN